MNTDEKLIGGRYRYATREFLNELWDTSPAAIRCSIRGINDANYSIRINDCNDRVRLHGDLESPATVSNAIHKVTTMINELTKFRVLAEVGEIIVLKPHSSTNACYSTKVSS